MGEKKNLEYYKIDRGRIFGMKSQSFLLLREGHIKHSGCPMSLKNNSAFKYVPRL